MKRTILFAFIVLLLFTSCIKSRIMKQPGMDFEPTDPLDIDIYYLEPDWEYIKIGMVETSGAPLSSWYANEERMKVEASRIGGHAIIIIEKDKPVKAIDVYGNIRRNKELTGIVIRWKLRK